MKFKSLVFLFYMATCLGEIGDCIDICNTTVEDLPFVGKCSSNNQVGGFTLKPGEHKIVSKKDWIYLQSCNAICGLKSWIGGDVDFIMVKNTFEVDMVVIIVSCGKAETFKLNPGESKEVSRVGVTMLQGISVDGITKCFL